MLLTLDEYRALKPESVGFDDEALQLLLDAAETEIERAAGPVGVTTDYITAGGHLVVTARRISSIESITETSYVTPTDVTTLATDDYILWPGGYVVERQPGGTNSRYRWFGRVAVSYIAVDDIDIRKVVQADLTTLLMTYAPGVTSEQVGAWSRTLASNSVWNQLAERSAVLARLTEPGRMLVI